MAPHPVLGSRMELCDLVSGKYDYVLIGGFLVFSMIRNHLLQLHNYHILIQAPMSSALIASLDRSASLVFSVSLVARRGKDPPSEFSPS